MKEENKYTDQQSRIDDYITGRMDVQERANFEQELESDKKLRDEYQLQSTIAREVRLLSELKEEVNELEQNRLMAKDATDREPGHNREMAARKRWRMRNFIILGAACLCALFIGVNVFTSHRNSSPRLGTSHDAGARRPAIHNDKPVTLPRRTDSKKDSTALSASQPSKVNSDSI